MATGNTPAMLSKVEGKGSQYLLGIQDADGEYLDGAMNYKLTVPANVPVNEFWSLVLYDVETRSMMIRDDIPAGQDFPSISSYSKGLKTNGDGSVDLYMGPKAPEGMESNWIRTVPGKSWISIFRVYGPEKPFFDQTWKLNDMEKVK